MELTSIAAIVDFNRTVDFPLDVNLLFVMPEIPRITRLIIGGSSILDFMHVVSVVSVERIFLFTILTTANEGSNLLQKTLS